MNRIAGALLACGLILLAIGPVAAVQLPVASVSPKTGLAGTEISITVSQYSPNIVIEVHETTVNGNLIGTGTTDGSGIGTFPITIPATAPTGSYLMYICGLCTSQFPEWATRGFQVTGPAPATSTTTTVAATTTTVGATTTTTAAATTTAMAAPATTVTNTTTVAAPSNGGVSGSGTPTAVWVLVGLIAVLVAFGAGIASQGRPKALAPPPPPPTSS